jgi:hypothetical protein
MDNLYLAPLVGLGTRASPFQPLGTVGLGTPWSMVDLRANPALLTGSCLLASPVPLADVGLTLLGNDRISTLSALTATALTTALGVPGITAGMTIEALLQLLLFGSDGAWRSVRPSRFTGFKEAVFNGVVWTSVFTPGAVRAENTMGEDNFVRADETPIAGNWSTDSTFTPGLRLLTNALQGGSAGNALSSWNAFTPADDQFSQVQVLVLGTSSDFGPTCRGNNAGSAYIALANTGAEGIAKFTAGTYSSIAAVAITPNLAVGDIFRLECEGSTLRMVRNGLVLGSTTDTSFTAGSVGVHIFPTNSRMKDWRGGDITSLRRLNAAGFMSDPT